MGLSHGHGLSHASTTVWPARQTFAPASLTALFDEWDAEQAASLTLVGSVVSAWRTTRNAYSAEQATSSSRPAWSATGFNGRPGLSFDGVDDHMTLTGVGNFPTGATPCEIWALVDQTALVADTTVRNVFSYGDTGGSPSRRMQRRVGSGVNRASGQVTNLVASNTLVDLSGRHVVRVRIGATAIQTDVDGVAGASVAAVPATGTTRARIGASEATTPGNFFAGVINYIGVFAPLTTSEAAQMTAFLKARGGIA